MDQGRRNLFSAHVANIPAQVLSNQLRDLFMAAGEVVEVYMSDRMREESKFTYAFVRFKTAEEVLKAVELMNNVTIENFKISVTLSSETEVKMRGSHAKLNYTSSTKSIVRTPMPRLERNKFTVLACDERHIHQKLRASLNYLRTDVEHLRLLDINSDEEIKSFMKDLRDVFSKTSSVPFGVCAAPMTLRGEDITKSTLEDIIIRYHDTSAYKVPFKDIDLDLSNNRTISEKDQLKLFDQN